MSGAFDFTCVPYTIRTSAPSASDIAYTVPYDWLDATTNKWYRLVDITAGSATWQNMSDDISHALATAENDFLVGTAGGGAFIKKTLAQTKAILEIVDPLVYKGVIDCSANPNYPTADAGHVYFVSVAGKIGGASGIVVDAGDKLVCKTDASAAGDQATVGTNWGIVQGNLEYETSTAEIKMNGAVAVGTSAHVPRADHVHASDTAKADKVVPAAASNLAGLTAAGNLEDSLVPAADAAAAISASHTQGTDQGLDTGGANAVTAADLKTLKDTTVPSKAAATHYEYATLPIAEAINGASGPEAISTLSSTGKVDIRNFDDAADEDVLFVWDVPPDLTGSTTIAFRVICWVSNATGPSNEGWAFFLQGASVGNGDILSSALGTAVKSSVTGRTDAQYDRVATDWSAAVTVTDLLAGETALLKLYRDVSDADDDYAQDIGVSAIQIKYTRTVGS